MVRAILKKFDGLKLVHSVYKLTILVISDKFECTRSDWPPNI